MKILSAAILIASVPLSTASAQLGKDASYFCAADFTGGVIYDEGIKKWKGTADGNDNNNNTPSIEGGTCTKID
jgi:hypothetical protein